MKWNNFFSLFKTEDFRIYQQKIYIFKICMKTYYLIFQMYIPISINKHKMYSRSKYVVVNLLLKTKYTIFLNPSFCNTCIIINKIFLRFGEMATAWKKINGKSFIYFMAILWSLKILVELIFKKVTSWIFNR